MILLTTLISLALGALLLSLIRSKPQQQSQHTIEGLSLIIPFRNEEQNIPALLKSLNTQQCTPPFEILLINDASTDNSKECAFSELKNYPKLTVTIIDLPFDSHLSLTSKQQALELGVATSQYQWLVFTDADMFYHPHWLQSLVDSVDKSGNPFIFGRTKIAHTQFFTWLQDIQLTTLFAIAWLFSRGGIMSSCMGNNILLKKEFYNKIGGQHGIGYTITEDQGLLAHLRSIGITPQPALPFTALATTYGEETLKGYLHQIIRWAKGGAKGSWQLALAISVIAGYFFALIIAVLIGNYSPILLPTLLLFTYLLWGFIAINEIAMLLYLPILVIWGTFQLMISPLVLLLVRPQWKGRNI